MIKHEDTTHTHSPELSPEQIASIYPTAKTYEEKMHERHQREQAVPNINIYLLATNIAVRIYALLALCMLVALVIAPNLITSNIISGVFFTFLLALTWVGVAWWQLSSVSRSFYFVGLNLAVFVLVYCMAAAPLIYGLFLLGAHIHNPFVVFLLSVTIHFGVCYALMALLAKGKR
ncbi:hypothetical protein D3C85_1042910 [compost metagenome]